MSLSKKLTDDELQRALQESRSLEDAPPGVIERAIGVFQRTPVSGLARAAEVLRAVLSFDSALAGPLAAGLRSVSTDQRQLLFTVESHDIDLRIMPAPADDAGQAQWQVAGQVLGPQAQGSVELQLGSEVLGHAVLNELGEFRFGPIASGELVLRMSLTDASIELPAIDVA
jgi:hypothetical protein